MDVAKTCPRCQRPLPIESFARDKHKASGVKSLCKECDRVKARAYYQANLADRREYYREQNAEQRRSDPEGYREAVRRRYREHRDRAVAIYGACCAMCGETHGRLEFDHVNGGGEQHRAVEKHRDYVARISRTGARLPDVQLQLLCVPCHRHKTRAQHRRGPDGRYATSSRGAGRT